jgi:predicted membrane protein DUF2157
MITFERELSALEADGRLDAAMAARLRAIERREIFSVYPELRALSWAGVMLIVGGVGVLVGKNLDRVGPVTLAMAMALASAACYAYALWRRKSARASLVDDYVLLLGALLLSADLGYIEAQFALLEQGWPRYLVLLAVAHGAGAYLFGSRALLALSISALASWIGIEQRLTRTIDQLLFHHAETAARMYACAAIVLVWRLVDQRVRAARDFEPVFDHFVANFALSGSLILAFDAPYRLAGTILTLAVAGAVVSYGIRRGSEAFVLYAYAYAVVAVDVLVVVRLRSPTAGLLFLVVSTIAAIIGLFVLHGVYRRRTS